jgi:hypothetical protein
LTQELSEIKGSTESRVDIKLEQNSRAINWSLHIYSGVTKEEIDNAVFHTKYGKKAIEKMLETGEV